MLGGRLFQSVGAATQKALSPTVRSLARGMMRLSFSEDRRDLDWEWESSVLYDTEHLLGNLRRTVQMRCIRNLSDFEYFCKDKCTNIVTSMFAMLIDSYPKD